MGKTYAHEAPVLLKDHHDERRQDQRSAQHKSTKLPRDFPLARARVHPLHDSQDIEARQQIEDLEHEVPDIALNEDIEVPRAEDEGVEELGDERYTLGRAIAMDGEDEDAFGRSVRQVADNAEDLASKVSLSDEEGK
jgi:hypothetical protein